MNAIKVLIVLVLMASAQVGCQSRKGSKGSSQAPSHKLFDDILDDHVKGDIFDYEALKDDPEDLAEYLEMISEHPPADTWTQEEKLAFWINAYNAYTIKLIVDNYPVKSIRDLNPKLSVPMVNTIWKKKFFKIGWVEMSLDEIEHQILRKEFDEPRIHFAINCASVSCPPLRDEAYKAGKIYKQLEEQAVNFINDERRNKISADNPQLSKIFSWFRKDFKKEGSLIDFLNKYSHTEILSDADIDYLNFDWRLNDVN